MQKSFGIAAGAGLASALLVAALAKGSVLALIFLCVTPLPLMIAALGFGQANGLLASAIASCAIGIVLGPLPGLSFGMLLAFPAWWLAYLVLLARPVKTDAVAFAAPVPVIWYPVGRIVTWGAALASAAMLGLGAVTIFRFGSFTAAVNDITSRMELAIGSSSAADAPAAVGTVVQLLPSVVAGLVFQVLMMNLWLASRVVQRSGLLVRPWSPLPETLRLPSFAAAILVGACIVSAFGGPAGIVASVIVAPLSIAFMLQGLGAAHALTRGLAARRLILLAIYFITFSIVPSLLALAVLGLIDCLLPLRRKHQPPTPSPSKP